MIAVYNKIFLQTLLFCLWFIKIGKCANILALMPVASPSHHLWNCVVTHALAERGHNVTILSVDIPKPNEKIPKTAHYIYLEKAYSTLYDPSVSQENININELIGDAAYKDIPNLYVFSGINNKGVTTSKGFQQLLDYPDNFKFDLVLYDYTIGGPILGFLHKFNYPPLVGLSAFHSPPITIDFVGGHYYPSYVPYHSLTYDTNMNFIERLYNTFLYYYELIYRRMYYTPDMDKMMRKYFPNDIPYLGDLQNRMALALVNSHPSINYAEPFPPSVIEIGGLQIKEPKPLDKELEEFCSKSKKGIILFSLGTNMKPSDVGDENINKILSVMEKFPDYHFLWKFDKNYIKRKIPSNVIVRTFFQQKDVLAHPKIKLFVTHAGGMSTQEVTWRGVPMVGIPLFVDQHRNLHKSLVAGVAVKVDYPTLTEDSLRNAINEVLTNKTYAENMKIRSERLRDRPMKPLDKAIWWIEYILRHPDPQHLKSPTIQLGFFIANSLDILAFVLIVVFIIFIIIFKFITSLLKFIQNAQSKSSDKKNN